MTEARWTTERSAELYEPQVWGEGYFVVRSDGSLGVRPGRSARDEVDLLEIVHDLARRGLRTPLLVRFPGILRDRLRRIHDIFDHTIERRGYRGAYEVVYPIKVNHQRAVVDALLAADAERGCGLEVGSKPELLAALALSAAWAAPRPIVCNGFKDSSYLEAVVLASKLDRDIVPVIEGLDELDLLIRHAERYGVCPTIGVRVRLDARGSGRWQASNGPGSKFGLTATEILGLVDRLDQAGLLENLQLVHAHAGSQIQEIDSVAAVSTELARIYTELVRLGAPMNTIDIGGGLAVDYDGSPVGAVESMNYSLAQYADAVVERIAAVCDDRGIRHPRILSESGRALVAHHSVLVFEVLGAISDEHWSDAPPASDGEPEALGELRDILASLRREGLGGTFRRAELARHQAAEEFARGDLPLELRSVAERLFRSIRNRVGAIVATLDDVPDELSHLDAMLADTYHGNLSIFQSLPDAWAIGQRFPVMPIHRLDERPGRNAAITDITCDSDGRIDRFAGADLERRTLPVHELRDEESYYLGVFMTGAYQETLGDLHNLFGDTHVAQIDVRGSEWHLEEVVHGDSARAVLGYVQYEPDRLREQIERDCAGAVSQGRVSDAEARALLRFYEGELDGYTYLTDAPRGG